MLLVSDESLSVYDVGATGARLFETIAWPVEGFEETVSRLIQKAAKGKSVVILNDMTDQHFKGGQTLPRVGLLDKASVLQRKLQLAFPQYPIRGALPIKADKGAKKTPGKSDAGDSYLFAAVPMSEPIAKTTGAIQRSMASVAGLFLLPIESSDMVYALATKIAGRQRPVSRWAIFIGQHKNGGLRQVIVRDGQLAMTRMTPLAEVGSHEEWARDVYQEFKSTIGYLSRFGYSPDQSTDVIVIAHPSAGKDLEKLIDIPCHYTTYTANEAGITLGSRVGARDEDAYFADSLHVAWAGRKKKFILPLSFGRLDTIHRARKAVAAGAILLVLAAGYLSWELFQKTGSVLSLREELSQNQRWLQQAESDYQAEVERVNSLGYDINLIQGGIDTYDDLEKKRIHVLPLIAGINEALGGDLRLDSLKLEELPPKVKSEGFFGVPAVPEEEADDGPRYKALLKMNFPRTIDPEIGIREVSALRNRLEKTLPGHEVIIRRNLVGLDYSAEFSRNFRNSARDISKDNYVAEIEIRRGEP